MELIRLEKKPNENAISQLKEVLSLAEKGELKSLLMIVEDSGNNIDYARVGVTHERAIGMHHRAAYKIQRDWDEANRS